MQRAPVIFWLYLLNELWRLILLTTCILVTVLSFAAAVRFLADGRMGPIDTIRWMFLTMPPMLQYALPFAAGFGATLAYHRACSDNELTAGHAAGISHRSILAPALLSGIVLGGVVLVLSNFVIPRFLRSAEELVTRDAARFIVGAIERKEAVQMENTLLYADLVRRYPATAGQDYEKLYLQGVFFVELDGQGLVKSQGSAREADVWLRRLDRSELAGLEDAPGEPEAGETVTHVTVRTRGMVGAKSTGRIADESNTFSKTIPNAFSDDPKFLSWDELIRLRHEPERLNVIDARRRILGARLAERVTTGVLSRSLSETGMIRLVGDEDTDVKVYAGAMHWDLPSESWIVTPRTDSGGRTAPLLIERRSTTGRILRQHAENVSIKTAVNPESPEREVTITLSMSAVSAAQETAAGAAAPAVSQFTIGELLVPEADVATLMAADTRTLLAAADERLTADPSDNYVREPRNELRRRVADLMREITSKQHERFASAAACLVMIMTGSVMAIKLRAKLPLEVYLWAFFPALATTIAISAGQQMIHAQGLAGVPVMWAGVVGLAVYTFTQYRHVARH